mgnify:CR=1 FL=1
MRGAPGDNEAAFLALIRMSEGTAREPDPYRVCYGYRHVIQSLDDHPKATGEWSGERLPDEMCRGAGLRPGCVSTAAGAYQIIYPTWRSLQRRLRLPDFGPTSQDRAALALVAGRGALDDVRDGRIQTAVAKCAREWASLPGGMAGQPHRRMDDLIAAYAAAGGAIA